MDSKKNLSPAAFIVAALCFVLPFVSVTCGGAKAAEFTGIQLVTGTTVGQSNGWGGGQQKINPELLAIAALVAILLGAVAGFAKPSKTSLSVLSAIAVLCFVGLLIKLPTDAHQNRLEVDFLFGFWLSVVFTLAAGIFPWLLKTESTEPMSQNK